MHVLLVTIVWKIQRYFMFQQTWPDFTTYSNTNGPADCTNSPWKFSNSYNITPWLDRAVFLCYQRYSSSCGKTMYWASNFAYMYCTNENNHYKSYTIRDWCVKIKQTKQNKKLTHLWGVYSNWKICYQHHLSSFHLWLLGITSFCTGHVNVCFLCI